MIPLSFPRWQVAHGGTQAPWHQEPITNLKSTCENEGRKNVKFCSSIFITNLRKMSPNINVKSTTYLHTNLTNEQSNWVPKLQRLSVQQIFHLSKNKHCSNWMERGRVPKEQSNSVGKLRRIEDWGFDLWKRYCSRWMERVWVPNEQIICVGTLEERLENWHFHV